MDKQLLIELINEKSECEWIEYKENWFNREELGEYISALSNSATEHGVEEAYFIWGINNKTHDITGTTFNPDCDVKNEPLKHYLARNLNPSIAFEIVEGTYQEKRINLLT